MAVRGPPDLQESRVVDSGGAMTGCRSGLASAASGPIMCGVNTILLSRVSFRMSANPRYSCTSASRYTSPASKHAAGLRAVRSAVSSTVSSPRQCRCERDLSGYRVVGSRSGLSRRRRRTWPRMLPLPAPSRRMALLHTARCRTLPAARVRPIGTRVRRWRANCESTSGCASVDEGVRLTVIELGGSGRSRPGGPRGWRRGPRAEEEEWVRS